MTELTQEELFEVAGGSHAVTNPFIVNTPSAVTNPLIVNTPN